MVGLLPSEGAAEQAGTEHTYRVVRLVASSSVSWEEAARLGVREASKTVSELRHAAVTDMDSLVDGAEVVWYRVGLELAYQLDRSRPGPTPSSPEVTVSRYLLVANETLEGGALAAAVSERMERGPAEFHVLVPATRSAETRRLTSMAGDPLSGYAVGELVGIDEALARDRHLARTRLGVYLDQLASLDAVVTSEVGGPDPFAAMSRVLERASFDEIIISTLPSAVSRWLRLDLPSRARRAWSIPVTTVIDDG